MNQIEEQAARQMKAARVIEALQPCRDAGLSYWWCAKHDCEASMGVRSCAWVGYCQITGEALKEFLGE